MCSIQSGCSAELHLFEARGHPYGVHAVLVGHGGQVGDHAKLDDGEQEEHDAGKEPGHVVIKLFTVVISICQEVCPGRAFPAKFNVWE